MHMDAVALHDGRMLEYTVTGPADGIPLVFHHGTPMSALQIRALQRVAHGRGLRLIAYSRPGYGDSTRRPGRDVARGGRGLRRTARPPRRAALPRGRLVRRRPARAGHGGRAAQRVAAVAVLAGVAPYTTDDLDFTAGMGEANVEEFEAAARARTCCGPGSNPKPRN